MRFFLNPIQFGLAANAAGVVSPAADQLYFETTLALDSLTSDQIKAGVSSPLPLRKIPAAARSPLRDALERQKIGRAHV